MLRRITFHTRPPWRPRHLFLSTMPKSGGMYLAKALSRISGYPLHQIVPTHFLNEQDICPQQLWWLMRPRMLWHHAKANEFNVRVMERYGIRPVVHVRNIYDVVLSINDFTELPHIRGNSGPQGHVHRQFQTMTAHERIDYLIHMQLPWYFSYLVSWREASERLDVLWTSYRELFSDQLATFRRILEFNKMNVSDEEITQALNSLSRKETNFNKGVAGRAEEVLTLEQRRAVQRQAEVWKLDPSAFEPLGITADELIGLEC